MKNEIDMFVEIDTFRSAFSNAYEYLVDDKFGGTTKIIDNFLEATRNGKDFTIEEYLSELWYEHFGSNIGTVNGQWISVDFDSEEDFMSFLLRWS